MPITEYGVLWPFIPFQMLKWKKGQHRSFFNALVIITLLWVISFVWIFLHSNFRRKRISAFLSFFWEKYENKKLPFDLISMIDDQRDKICWLIILWVFSARKVSIFAIDTRTVNSTSETNVQSGKVRVKRKKSIPFVHALIGRRNSCHIVMCRDIKHLVFQNMARRQTMNKQQWYFHFEVFCLTSKKKKNEQTSNFIFFQFQKNKKMW